eukprot:4099084-Prymnesium_polylepis.3
MRRPHAAKDTVALSYLLTERAVNNIQLNTAAQQCRAQSGSVDVVHTAARIRGKSSNDAGAVPDDHELRLHAQRRHANVRRTRRGHDEQIARLGALRKDGRQWDLVHAWRDLNVALIPCKRSARLGRGRRAAIAGRRIMAREPLCVVGIKIVPAQTN